MLFLYVYNRLYMRILEHPVTNSDIEIALCTWYMNVLQGNHTSMLIIEVKSVNCTRKVVIFLELYVKMSMLASEPLLICCVPPPMLTQ